MCVCVAQESAGRCAWDQETKEVNYHLKAIMWTQWTQQKPKSPIITPFLHVSKGNVLYQKYVLKSDDADMIEDTFGGVYLPCIYNTIQYNFIVSV